MTLELNTKGVGNQKKHAFLKRSGTRPKKEQSNKSSNKVAQNNGLVGFNKGMTYSDKKGKSKVKLAHRKSYIPPGGQSSLNLFSETNIPDPRELIKQNQLRPLSQEQPDRRDYESPPKFDRNHKHNYHNYHDDNYNRSYNEQEQRSPYNNYQQHDDESYSHNNHFNNKSQNRNNYYDNDGYQNNYYQQKQNNQYQRNDSRSSENDNQETSRNRHQIPHQYQNQQQNCQSSEVFGRSNSRVSSNTYANGASQNCGNVITERSSTRVHAPPGGASNFSLAHVEERQQQRTLPPIDNWKNNDRSQDFRLKQDEQLSINSNQGIGALIQRAKGAQLPNEFGLPLEKLNNKGSELSRIPRISGGPMKSHQKQIAPLAPIQRQERRQPDQSAHNPMKVPGLENHYSERQKNQFGRI
jgi:hypothetical protein